MVNRKRTTIGRLVFDAVDMLNQAAGLPTPEGFAVITKDFAHWLEEELQRLYEIEELTADFLTAAYSSETSPIPLRNHESVRQLAGKVGVQLDSHD